MTELFSILLFVFICLLKHSRGIFALFPDFACKPHFSAFNFKTLHAKVKSKSRKN